MQVYKILLPILIDEPFDYKSGSPLVVGDIVKVPFRTRTEIGVVWGIGNNEVASDKIKEVAAKLDIPPLKPELMKFIEFAASYNITPLGTVLKLLLSVKFIKKAHKATEQKINFTHAELSKKQETAAGELRQDVKNHQFSVSLLDGVTGSGKTEVYFEAIEEAINDGKQVLVMLPEIALSHQWLMRFEKRFGLTPSVWHSDRSVKERRETWLDVANGASQLVVGARSALFLPFQNLGLIIVDEEHDQSYKQEEGTIYHARDMAVARAKFEEVPAVLVSATPSIESVNNVQEGKYKMLHLPERFGGAKLPKIEIVDMRKEKLKGDEFISSAISKSLRESLTNGQQSVLFLNRRGYAPLTLCRACGHRMQCPNCSAWLVMHQPESSHSRLNCHHCGYWTSTPKACPACKKEGNLHACGPGVERVAEEVKAKFPEAAVEVMSSDSPKAADEIVKKMLDHDIDILVGTQMIAKGHHFPRLAFVGIIDADLGLEGGDLRAMERTYQLLHQVSGRAGREEEIGKVIIQTYNPHNVVIDSLAHENRDKFVAREIAMRKEHEVPPFGRLATVTVSGRKEDAVKKYVRALALGAPQAKDAHVFGPAPAPMSYLRGQYRHRLLIKAPRKFNIQEYIRAMLAKHKTPSGMRVKVDVDPYNFV